MNTHVRWMIRRDIDEILAFDPDQTEANALETLRQRDVIGQVAEDKDSKVVGYFMYQLHKTYLTILHFFVSPDQRAKGYGRALMERLKGKLNSRRYRLRFDVSDGQIDMHLFLRAMGFSARVLDSETYRFGYVHVEKRVPVNAVAG